MAYCDIDDVRGYNPKRTYSAATTPTSTQVEEYVDRVSDTIDTILLGRNIAVPVAAPDEFVGDLKHGNAIGAAALAEIAMFPEAVGSPGGSPHGHELWVIYQDFLKWLRAGKLPMSVVGAKARSFFEQRESADTAPEADHEWQKPKFGKDKEF